MLFAGFLYVQNRVRILRSHSHTVFSTRKLDRAEAFLWGLPLSLLAAAFGLQLTASGWAQAWVCPQG